MRLHKSTILIALMALLLSAFVAVMAQQGTAQNDQNKQAEACCAMDSCCCKGDSCPLKKEGAHAEAKDGCCCSSGGCEMKKEGAADVATAAKADANHAGCCGDSCDMAKHDPAKHDMAAGGDMAKQGNHDKKSHAGGSCCNAMHKDAKHKEMKKQPAN